MLSGNALSCLFVRLYALHELHGHLIKEERGRIGREGSGHGRAKALEPDLPVATAGLSLKRLEALPRAPIGEVALHPRLDHILRVARHPSTESSDTTSQQ